MHGGNGGPDLRRRTEDLPSEGKTEDLTIEEEIVEFIQNQKASSLIHLIR